MAISISDKRPQKMTELIINENIQIYATGAIKLNVPFLVKGVDFFPSSFKVVIDERIIFIDPVKIEEKVKADLILITHSHQDHLSVEDIVLLSSDETIIICPKRVYKKVRKRVNVKSIDIIKPFEQREINGLSVAALPSYNRKKGLLTAHPKKKENVGYLIGYGDFKLYHSGDTDYVDELNHVEHVTVAMIPIDGGDLTMSTEQAADFINQLKPTVAIPMHYQIGAESLDYFKDNIDEKTEVIIMDGQ